MRSGRSFPSPRLWVPGAQPELDPILQATDRIRDLTGNGYDGIPNAGVGAPGYPRLIGNSPWGSSYGRSLRFIKSGYLDVGVLNLGSTFTLEGKVLLPRVAGEFWIGLGKWGNTTAAQHFALVFDNNVLQFFYRDSTGTQRSPVSSAITAGLHDFAIACDGTTIWFFCDGVASGSAAFQGFQTPDATTHTEIGAEVSGNETAEFWLDEVRVSNIARYTTTYTPPSAPFSVDSNTVALWRMDTAPTTISPTRPIADSVSISDSAAAHVSDSRTSSDAVSFSDSVARVAGDPRGPSDSWAIADSAVCTVAHPRSLSDSWSVSDAAAEATGFPRAIADSWSVSDAAARVAGDPRGPADSLGVSDAVAALLGYVRRPGDSIVLSDQASQSISVARGTADAISGLTDAVARTVGAPRGPGDSWAIADSTPTQTLGYIRLVYDQVLFSDVATGFTLHPRAPADGWGVADVATERLSAPRTTQDGFSVVDQVARSVSLRGTAADTWTMGEAVTRSVVFARQLADAFDLGDEGAQVSGFPRGPAESWGIVDSVSRTASPARGAVDAFTILDHVGRSLSLQGSAVDVCPVSDMATAIFGRSLYSADTWSITDFAVERTGAGRGASDVVVFSDRAAGQITLDMHGQIGWITPSSPGRLRQSLPPRAGHLTRPTIGRVRPA